MSAPMIIGEDVVVWQNASISGAGARLNRARD
jgi:hypothetical protein